MKTKLITNLGLAGLVLTGLTSAVMAAPKMTAKPASKPIVKTTTVKKTATHKVPVHKKLAVHKKTAVHKTKHHGKAVSKTLASKTMTKTSSKIGATSKPSKTIPKPDKA